MFKSPNLKFQNIPTLKRKALFLQVNNNNNKIAKFNDNFIN